MKIAVEGCCHGELDAIYKKINSLEQQNGYNVDLVLICGDYQAVRTQADLNCMSVPAKHLKMGDYHSYYTGEKVAPILTVVIGGNHEASNHFWELYHGGWLAPNIYYLGCAGVVQFNGLRIAGTSGIYKSHDFRLGHFETLPYDRSTIRSIYHTRQFDITRLAHISPPDVFLSHDWPLSIEQHGDVQGLLRKKPFFAQDIQRNDLGSPPLMDLLRQLRPKLWFAGHMHVKFEAEVIHGASAPVRTQDLIANPDEIQISMDDDDEGESSIDPKAVQINQDEILIEDEEAAVNLMVQPPPERPTMQGAIATHFIALDKCLPRRDFLEIIDIDAPAPSDPPKFTFDTEWLAITRAFHPYLSISRLQLPIPPRGEMFLKIEEEMEWIKTNVLGESEEPKDVGEVQHFIMTSPGPIPGFKGNRFPAPSWYTNPQTVAFCEMLGIENKINPPPPGMDKPIVAPEINEEKEPEVPPSMA